ncbi:LysR family transcriptional regulator [uncultured Roseovarius sp.]|uniref:LysR family transcriptional regulator n=1 Tax=uncultured Roseovarius sp. TaxID=293344 RepID=UPI00262A3B71|nr:LysR family transcriptional regulator [uncultured Roseovarius sp.]
MKKVDVLSLDGKLLRVFLAVYDTQSVTKAAVNLETGQSAVSHSLDRLRECIGDPLFVKSGRGIAPTDTASLMAPKIQKILTDIEGLSTQNNYNPRTDTNDFTVATNVTELLPVLLSVKERIRNISGEIPLQFIELGPRTNTLETLSSGKADLVISVSIGPYPVELSIEHLYQDQIVCFFDHSQRSAPLTVEAYCAARHAVLSFGGDNKSIVDAALDYAGFSRRVSLAASNSFALASLMRGTNLLATLPKRLHTTAFEGFYVSNPPISLPLVRYDLVWHRRMQNSERNKWFRTLMREAAADFDIVKNPASVSRILAV